MSDTSAVLAAIERLQAECRSSQAAVMENAPLYFGLALSALEALVKEREALENGGHEEICNASAVSYSALADFVAAIGKKP